MSSQDSSSTNIVPDHQRAQTLFQGCVNAACWVAKCHGCAYEGKIAEHCYMGHVWIDNYQAVIEGATEAAPG